MRVIFDKNTANEREIKLSFYAEQARANRFSGNDSIEVKAGTDFPDISELVANPDFDTVTVINGKGVTIPLAGNYNTISSVNVTYNDNAGNGNGIYSVDMTLEYVERETREPEEQEEPEE